MLGQGAEVGGGGGYGGGFLSNPLIANTALMFIINQK